MPLAGRRQRLWTGILGRLDVGIVLYAAARVCRCAAIWLIDVQYQPQGAALRLAMNAVPAVLFLWLMRRFVMQQDDRTFWSWMSLGALAFVGLLVVSPSSTAVDRVA